MNKAILVKNSLENFSGHANLYRCEPPLHGEYEYVIASAINHGWAHETYLFPANEHGEVIDWGELDGSLKDTTSHAEVFTGLNYEITS